MKSKDLFYYKIHYQCQYWHKHLLPVSTEFHRKNIISYVNYNHQTDPFLLLEEHVKFFPSNFIYHFDVCFDVRNKHVGE